MLQDLELVPKHSYTRCRCNLEYIVITSMQSLLYIAVCNRLQTAIWHSGCVKCTTSITYTYNIMGVRVCCSLLHNILIQCIYIYIYIYVRYIRYWRFDSSIMLMITSMQASRDLIAFNSLPKSSARMKIMLGCFFPTLTFTVYDNVNCMV